MITQTVFDADGGAHVLEPVDAREYLESGSYFSKPPKKGAAAVDAEPPADADAVDAPARAKPGPKPKK